MLSYKKTPQQDHPKRPYTLNAISEINVDGKRLIQLFIPFSAEEKRENFLSSLNKTLSDSRYCLYPNNKKHLLYLQEKDKDHVTAPLFEVIFELGFLFIDSDIDNKEFFQRIFSLIIKNYSSAMVRMKEGHDREKLVFLTSCITRCMNSFGEIKPMEISDLRDFHQYIFNNYIPPNGPIQSKKELSLLLADKNVIDIDNNLGQFSLAEIMELCTTFFNKWLHRQTPAQKEIKKINEKMVNHLSVLNHATNHLFFNFPPEINTKIVIMERDVHIAELSRPKPL